MFQGPNLQANEMFGRRHRVRVLKYGLILVAHCRRLKGEDVKEGEEFSTYGIEVWACERSEGLDARDDAWKQCKGNLLDDCVARSFQGRRTDISNEGTTGDEARSRSKEEAPDPRHEISQSGKPEEGPQGGKKEDLKEHVNRVSGGEARTASEGLQNEGQEDRGPILARQMGVELVLNASDANIAPRLQCFDFPG